jgi:hypothetical protein
MIDMAQSRPVMVWSLPLAWMATCGVLDAPLVLGNTPTIVADSGVDPWIVGEASDGE